MTAFIKAEFAAPVVTEIDGEYHLFAQKTPFCRLGVYVVHFSIIIIFIGALLGSYFGYKGYANIVEGTSVTTAINPRGEKTIDLGFAVKCEKFSVSYYDTGAPKEFKSILTILDNGQPVPGYINIPVVVNSPLTYKGITFYQSSYGQAGEGAVYHFTVREKKGGTAVAVSARQGEKTPLPGGGDLQVLESVPEVKMYMPQFSGAAAKIEITTAGGATQQAILFQNFPNFDEQRGGDQIFTYDGAEEKYYTGLQVAKDPGVWVVWLGCGLMVAGICLAFFFSHKRIWFRITNGRVVVGGSASKNPAGFQILFDDLVGKLKTIK
jgi:cytochrome c biogenesis protein